MRLGQKLVFLAVLASLLAPMPAFCASVFAPARKAAHACCAPKAQLAAPSCCRSDASSTLAIPPQANTQVANAIEQVLLPAQWASPQQPVSSPIHHGDPPLILLPATILRT